MPQKTAASSLQIRALTERLGKDPRSRAFLDLAKAHLAAGDPGEAVRVCREGLEKHPAYHSARVILGKALVAAGSHGEAASELERVVKEAPDNILARRLLAEAQEAGGRRGDALSTYRSLLLLTPGEPEVEARIANLEAGTREIAPLPVATPGPAADAVPEPPGGEPPGERRVEFETIDVRPDPGLPPGGSGPLPPTVTLDASEMADNEAFDERPTQALDLPPELPAPAMQEVASGAAGEVPGGTAGEPILEEASGDTVPAVEPVLAGAGTEKPPVAAALPPAGAAMEVPAPSGPDAEALPTLTLAELYVEQGMPQMAVKVYEKILTNDPGNQEIRAKLSRLKAGAPAGSVVARRKIRALESWLGKIKRTRDAQSRT